MQSASLRLFHVLLAVLPVCIAGTTTVHAHASKPASASATVHETGLSDGVLALDEAMFWEGETLDGHVPDASLCEVSAHCPKYELTIAPGGKRLRVGIDTPERTDTFVIELLDPSGSLVTSESNSNQFNSEAKLLDPVAGTWTVRIRPEDVSKGSFRMRAKLESSIPENLPKGPGAYPLLPNLRTVPPYELSFTAPANPLNGVYPPDTVNPPLSVAGISPVSCSADEALPKELGGSGAVHCLRLTSGPMNMGPGLYDMRFRLIEDLSDGDAALNPAEAFARIVVGPMDQVVHYTDGSTETVRAGTYSFHPIHAHFHDDYVLSYELYAVTDEAKGRLVPAGEGNKSGFCPADQLFTDWFKFDQSDETPGGDSPFDNCFSPTDGLVGLSIGWGDVYRWQRPGQFVEFAGNGNGRYVVNSIVDANNHVMETDETDNVSYTYIEVEGDTIEILERGWGRSPWDPAKVEFRGPGPTKREASSVAASQTSDGGNTNRSSGGGGALDSKSLIAMLILFLLLRSQRTMHRGKTRTYL